MRWSVRMKLKWRSISQKFILVLHVVPPCYRPETTLVIRNKAIRYGWWRSRGHNAPFWGPSRTNDKHEQKREVTIVFVRGFTPLRCFDAVAQLWLTYTLTSGGLCTRTEPWSLHTSAHVSSSMAMRKLELEHPLLLDALKSQSIFGKCFPFIILLFSSFSVIIHVTDSQLTTQNKLWTEPREILTPTQ